MPYRRMVTCVCPVPAHPGILVSGSADGTVRSWRYMDGQLVSTHNLPSTGNKPHPSSLPFPSLTKIETISCLVTISLVTLTKSS